MRLGIFGGSFDPVHHGHLILARAALEELDLDRLLLLPANHSPHKTSTRPATSADRLAMLRLAIEGEENFAVEDLELHRAPPSYTIDTLRELRSRHPDAEFTLLIGADQAAKFDTWKDPAEIQHMARVAILDRAGHTLTSDWPMVRRLIDISSTDLRTRVAAGRSIRYLTPDSVCDYISRTGLYQNA
jgi:nicotinate-nucleotide adenylyltransferase